MYELISEETRGKVDLGWLKSSHSFSFGEYYNATRMGFGRLRVINDDYIRPQTGFGTHGHKNMEIITIVLEGEISHKDSQGNQETIQAGEVQVMSAGSGIRHSEMNQHKELATNLLQIWITPNEEDTEPGYQQKNFKWQETKGIFPIVEGTNSSSRESLKIKQDASLTLYNMNKDRNEDIQLNDKEGAYIFVIKGSIKIGDTELKERDAIEVKSVKEFVIRNEMEEAQYLVIKTTL